MRVPLLRLLVLAGLVCAVGVLSGCLTAEVKSASAALEQARSAGKDKQCPNDFAAAEDLVKRAELMCNQCKPSEANSLAAEAMAKINGLCPAKPVVAAPAPAPAPAPSPAAAPTVSLNAIPNSIDEGKCTTLSWTATNATSVSIDPGVGSVSPSGSKEVCPTSTTRYTITVNGPGGTKSDSTSVGVTPKKPTDKLTIHVNFNSNKSDIRKADIPELQKAEAFVKKYSTCKIEVDGYTDSTGGDRINIPLSERRADAVKKWLVDHGAVSGDTITTKGNGSSNPVGSNKTAKGKFENRRAEILAFCQ
jgi:OmpA-OmpF porin, OOP family